MSKVQTMPLEIWTDINGNAARTQFKGGTKYIRADAQATVEALQRERDEADKRSEQCRKDRAMVLNVKTTDGLTASEWLMRTAVAEQKAKDLQAALDAEREKVKAAKAEVWREAAMKYALWVGEDSEVPADPHLDGYERFEEYCHDRAALDATTPATKGSDGE